MTLPVPSEPYEIRHHRRLLRAGALEQWLRRLVSLGQKSHEPLTLYQQSLVELADRLNEEARAGVAPRAGLIVHEHDAAVHIHESLRLFLVGRKNRLTGFLCFNIWLTISPLVMAFGFIIAMDIAHVSPDRVIYIDSRAMFVEGLKD